MRILTTLLLLFSLNCFACDGSYLNLTSPPTDIGGGQYQVAFDLCTTQGKFCQDASTGFFWFGSIGANIVSSTSPIISPHTGAAYSINPSCPNCPTGYSSVVSYTNSAQWFSINYTTGKPGCTTMCVSITMIFDGYPTSLTVLGLEGGNIGYGCPGETIVFTPLPIDLISFKVFEGNVLEWVTASEVNNDYFIIEHSSDGIKFNNIGEVIGRNYSTPSIYYFRHTDKSIGFNYYRLSQVDYNGKVNTFKTVSINNFKEYKKGVYYNVLGQLVNKNYRGYKIFFKK